ncbi:MAG: hypothetical protein R2874_12195 [Desulfobacterales bacterium]
MADRLARFVRNLLTGFWQPLGKVAYETTVTKSGQFSILGKTYNIDRLPDNQVVANALAAHPDKFYGWIFINPADTDAQSVIEEYADRPGWIGVKCHPFWHQYPVSILDDVAALCRAKELPLLIHLGGKKKTVILPIFRTATRSLKSSMPTPACPTIISSGRMPKTGKMFLLIFPAPIWTNPCAGLR